MRYGREYGETLQTCLSSRNGEGNRICFRVTNNRRIDEKGTSRRVPLLVLSLDHVVATYQVGLGHVGVYLGSVDVAVAEHALHNLNWDAGAETDGGGKGVAGAVGGELFAQVHLFAENRQLAVVADVGAVGQAEVVLSQDVQDDWQQDDGVALVCLLPVVVNQPVALHLSALCEVNVEQIDVGKAGVARDEETILHLLTFLALRLIGDEAVELFTRQKHTLLAAALHDVQAVVGVGGDDLAHDGLANDSLNCVVNLCDGGVGHQVRAVGLAAAQVLIEAAEPSPG